MNKDAYAITTSHEALSNMTEYELRELRRKNLDKLDAEYDCRKKPIQTELNNIEAEYDCRKKAIYDHYEHYIKVANERLREKKIT